MLLLAYQWTDCFNLRLMQLVDSLDQRLWLWRLLLHTTCLNAERPRSHGRDNRSGLHLLFEDFPVLVVRLCVVRQKTVAWLQRPISKENFFSYRFLAKNEL